MRISKYRVGSGVILAALVSLALAGEGEPARQGAAKSGAPVKPLVPTTSTNDLKKSQFPVLGYLQGRNQTIIIKAGEKGPVYSVKGVDGKVLFEDLSLDQLRAKAPQVHEFIKSAVAANPVGRGPVADASLRVPVR